MNTFRNFKRIISVIFVWFLVGSLPVCAVTLNKSFTPPNINAGDYSLITISIFNDKPVVLTNVAWSDTLPIGMTILSTPAITTNCGGTLVATPGTGVLSLTGASVPAFAGATFGQCDVVVPVKTTVQGNNINTIPAGNLTNTQGFTNTFAAAATLQVNSFLSPSISSTLNPATIFLGQNATYTVSLTNNDAMSNLTQAGWAYTLPTGLQVGSGTPLVSNNGNCGTPTMTAVAGTTAIALSNATVLPGATCVVTIPVTGNTQGNYTLALPVGVVSDYQTVTNATGSNQSIAVQSFSAATSFAPAAVKTNQVSVMTVTISSVAAYTNLAFIDDFVSQAGLVIAPTPNATTTCTGGTVTAVPGSQSLSLSGGTIAAGTYITPSVCTVSVNVVVPSNVDIGTKTHTLAVGAITGTLGGVSASNINAPSATLTVTGYTSPTLTKTFAKATGFVGEIVNLTIGVKNNDPVSFTNVGWTDTFPTGLRVAGTATLSAGCTGAKVVTAPLNGNSVVLSGATITTGATCTVTIPVAATQEGAFSNAMPIGAITDAQGTSNLTAVSASLTAANSLSVTKTFNGVTPATANTTMPITLLITLSNKSTDSYGSVTFSDDFSAMDAGFKIAPTPAVVNTCGGTVTANPNTQILSLSGGTIGAGTSTVASTCTVQVNVIASAAFAAKTNTIAAGAVTAMSNGIANNTAGQSVSNAVATSATLTTTAFIAPTISTSFATTAVSVGQNSNLLINIVNGSTTALTNASLTDTLVAGLRVAGAATFSAGCTGAKAVTAPLNGQSIALTGATIAAGATCTVTIPVAATQQGTFSNSIGIGALSTTEGASNTAAAAAPTALTATTLSATKTFNGSAAATANTSVPIAMVITINNNSTDSYGSLAFTDNFAASMPNLVVDTPLVASTTCAGGTVTAAVGGQSVGLTGGTIGAGTSVTATSCTVTVNVMANAAFTPAKTNTLAAGSITATSNGIANNTAGTTASNAAAASATLVAALFAPQVPTKSFAPATVYVGQTSTLTINVRNPNLYTTLSGVAWTDTLPLGMKVAATPAITKNANCGGAAVFAPTAGSTALTFSGVIPANTTCTVTVAVVADQESTGLNNAISVVSTESSTPVASNTATLITQSMIATKSFNGVTGATAVSVSTGNIVKLRVALSNYSTNALNSVAFTDAFGTSMGTGANFLIATTPNVVNTCGGTPVATAGTSTLGLSGGTLPAGNSTTPTTCYVEVDTVATAGFVGAINVLPIGAVTAVATANSTAATSLNAASATLTAILFPPPIPTKSFAPAVIYVGEVSTLTIAVQNQNLLAPLTGVAWTDTLPTGMTVAATPTVTTAGCGTPTFNPLAGATSLSFSGGSILANATCTVTVKVVADRQSTGLGLANTLPVGAITNNENVPNIAATTDYLTTRSMTVVKSFNGVTNGTTSTSVGSLVKLRVTVNNYSTSILNNVAFSDAFATSMGTGANFVIAPTPNLVNTCGGTPVATAGGNTLGLSGGSLAAGTAATPTTCYLEVDTVASAAFTAAPNTLPVDAVTATAANGTAATSWNTSTASLTIINFPQPVPTKSFAPATVFVGQTSTLTINVQNANAFAPLTGVAWTDTLPTGMTIAATPNVTNNGNCGTPTINTAVNTKIVFSGGTIPAATTCTITVDVVADRQSAGLVNSIPVNAITTTQGVTNAVAGSSTLVVQSLTAVKSFNGFTGATTANTTLNAIVKLRITINNPTTNAMTGLAFSDTFNSAANMNSTTKFKIATPANLVNTCGGTATGTQATYVLSLTGGSLPAGTSTTPSSCYVEVDTAANAAITAATNTIAAGGITATAINGVVPTNAAATSAILTAAALAVPTIPTKTFTPTTAYVGQSVTLTIGVKNNATVALTGVSWTDTLPTGMSVAGTPTATTASCGTPTFTPLAGDTVLSFSNGTIAANATCTITVKVVADRQSAGLVNTLPIGAVTTNEGVKNTVVSPTATLITQTMTAVKSFNGTTGATAVSVPVGSVVKLRVTLNNYSPNSLTGLAFNDDFGTGMGTLTTALAKYTIAATPNLVNTCGGTVTTAAGTSVSPSSLAGGTSLILTGGILAGGTSATPATCYVEVDTDPNAAFANGTNTIAVNAVTANAVNGVVPTNAAATFAKLTATVVAAPTAGKSFLTASVVAGQNSTLQITVKNNAASALTNVAWTDNLPAGLIVNGAATSASCGTPTINTAPNTQIAFSLGTIAGLATCTVSVPVTGTTDGAFVNTLPARAVSNDQNTTDPTVRSATLTVTTLALSKAFLPTTIAIGGTSVLTITVSNPTNLAYTNMSVVDNLPAGLVVAPTPNASTSCTGGAVTATAGSSSITLNNASILAATVVPTTPRTCTISVTVQALTSGAKTNTIAATTGLTATAPDSTITHNAALATASLTVSALSNLTVTKTFTPATILANGTASAMLHIGIVNPNPSSALDTLTVTDTFPVGMAGLMIANSPAATNTCNGTLTATAGTASVSLAGGTMLAGGSCAIDVPVVSTGLFNAQTNTVSVTAKAIGAQTVTGTATATLITTALTVTEAFSLPSVVIGGAVQLTITIVNNSIVPQTGVAFTDVFPTNYLVDPMPNVVSTCNGTVSITAANVGFSLAGGTIPANSSCSITLDVTGSVVGANKVNPISVTSTQQTTAATATASLSVVAPTVAINTLTKAFTPTSVSLLQNSTVRIDWKNTGTTGNTVNPIVTDNLPVGLIVATTPNVAAFCNAIAVPATTTISASRNQIVVALTATQPKNQGCYITFDVTPTQPGTLTNNLAKGDIISADLTTSANSVTASASLPVTNVLTIGKAFQPTALAPNDTSVLTITLTNPESVALTGANLTDTLPSVVPSDLLIATPANATTNCTASGVSDPTKVTTGLRTVTLTGGVIPPKVGAVNGVCTITVTVKPGGIYSTGSAVNTIPIGALTTTELRSNSNAATATITFVAPPPLAVNKSFSPTLVSGGSVSRLTVSISNPSIYPQSGLAFTDNMPAGMTVGSPPNPSTTCTGGVISGATIGSGVWSFSGGAVPAGGSCTVSLNVTSNIDGNLTNTIPAGGVTSSNGSSSLQDATASLSNLPGANFGKAFTPNPSVVNQPIRLTITLTNSSSTTPLTQMVFSDDFTLGGTQTGLTVAPTPNLTNTCRGTVTNTATSVSLSGGDLAPQASCQIGIDVATNTVGSYTNTIPVGRLTTAESVTNTNSSTDVLPVYAAIKAVKQLSPTSDAGRFVLTLSPNAAVGASSRANVGHDASAAAVTAFFANAGTTYTITETGQGSTNMANYLTSYQCVNADNTVLASGTGASATVTPPATGGAATKNQQDITCTFTNVSKQPLLTVNNVSNGGVGSFSFTGSNGVPTSATTITTTTAGVSATVAALTEISLTARNVATVIMDGALPTDFVLSGATCTGLQGADTATLVGGFLTIPATSIVDGARISCTFTHAKTSIDHGDAPAAFGDASHSVAATPTVYLGTAVPDADSSVDVATWQGQTTAAGDEGTGTADEGIAQLLSSGNSAFPALTTSPGSYSVTLKCAGTTTANAVSGWIDFNRNNAFDAGERAQGTCSAVSNGTVTLTWNTFTGINTGASFARFRIASNAVQSGSPASVAADGEAEDYALTIGLGATLKVTKVSVGGTGTFTFTGTNGWASQDITTASSGVGVSGAIQTLTATGVSTDIIESPPPAGYYLSGISCTGLGAGGTATNDLPNRKVTLNAAATAAGSAIVCTFTNTFSTGTTFTLRKQWVGATVNDAVNVTATGLTSLSAIANTASEVDTGITETVSSGAVITIGETYITGSAANYTASLACTGTTGLSGNVLTVALADTAIVCTQTNTFIGTASTRITGTVFKDTGAGGGTANNGIQDGAEVGLAGVAIAANQAGCTGGVCGTAITDGSGNYTLVLPASVTGAITLTEANLNGMLSTGGSAGTGAGTYTRSTDTVTGFNVVPGTSYTGLNFGDVPDNQFITDGAQTAMPGAMLFYPHQFIAGTSGSVAFGVTRISSPAATGWSELIYDDANCNAMIDGGEAPVAASVAVVAGQTVCLLVKEFVPATVSVNAQNALTVTANFTSTFANPTGTVNISYVRHDTTTAGQATAAGLSLVKSVSATTALPGANITYTVAYTNSSSGALSSVVINDATPAYTTYQSASCGALPLNFTGCSITAPAIGSTGSIIFTFAGTLAPASTGAVNFTVQVQP